MWASQRPKVDAPFSSHIGGYWCSADDGCSILNLCIAPARAGQGSRVRLAACGSRETLFTAYGDGTLRHGTTNADVSLGNCAGKTGRQDQNWRFRQVPTQ